MSAVHEYSARVQCMSTSVQGQTRITSLPDDAPPLPDPRALAEIYVPPQLVPRFLDEAEPLCVLWSGGGDCVCEIGEVSWVVVLDVVSWS
jgi:hypothetical protein